MSTIQTSSVKSAIVLCAGRGARLRPHTDSTPKPLLPVNGKPTLDFILGSLRLAGIQKVILVVRYLGEQIEQYAAEQTFYNSESIVCVQQQQLDGTASAAQVALAARPEWFSEPFLLTASDYLVPPDFYTELVQEYVSSGAAVAVSLKKLAESELAKRSSVRRDADGSVLEVVEKPAAGTAPSSFSANLVYILPPDIIADIKAIEPSPRGEREVQSGINAYLKRNGAAAAMEQAVPEEWSEGLL